LGSPISLPSLFFLLSLFCLSPWCLFLFFFHRQRRPGDLLPCVLQRSAVRATAPPARCGAARAAQAQVRGRWRAGAGGRRWRAGARAREEVRCSTSGSAWTSRETTRPPCEGAAARATWRGRWSGARDRRQRAGARADVEVLQSDGSGRTRPGGSRVAHGGRQRPLRRRQRTRSGGTASCSWRTWWWPGVGRPRSSRRRRSGYGVASSEGVAVQRQGGQGKSNVARVRRAAQDQRRW
jgi:hypothetical protein